MATGIYRTNDLEELRRAIEEPAKHGGWEFESGLVDILLHDIGAEATSELEPGTLSLLSHALLAYIARSQLGKYMGIGDQPRRKTHGNDR